MSGSQNPEPSEDEATRRYLDLIRDVHATWDRLEAAGDRSVQLSTGALATIKESVRADARHGAQVAMPPTPAGPFTVSELSLRTLVRRAIDAVPAARALRTSVDFADANPGERGRGLPEHVSCRISAAMDAPDLPALAEQVREAILADFRTHLGLTDVRVDIHIEDLHEH